MFRLDGGAEDPGGYRGDVALLVSDSAAAGHGGGGPDALQRVMRSACFTDAAYEHADVCALAAPVGMQLVEDEELQSLCCLDERGPFVGAREDEFEHDVVGQQDVGGIGQDGLAFCVVLLARVPLERDRGSAAVSVLQELAELLNLTVGQGIHRVDDDRLDALAAAFPQDPIDDRDDVGQRLARTGTGGQHVGVAASSYLDGVTLVTVQKYRRRPWVLLVGLGPEDPSTSAVEESGLDQFIDAAARGEAGVQAEPGVRPLSAACALFFYDLGHTLIAGADEALGERLVVGDKSPMHLECVHTPPSPFCRTGPVGVGLAYGDPHALSLARWSG